jgi:FMN-dependent NADH-azoreductase
MESKMSKLLFVTSSILGENSKSRSLGSEFVAAWRRAHPGTSVVERHLLPESLPHYTGSALGAAVTPAEKRTPEQAEAAALADALIAEIEAAETIVLAVPMYNFSIPSTFKAWIDHVVRAGRTFRYGAAGAEGLLRGKRVFIIASRGGIYTEGPAKSMDFHEPYLRAVLGFIGLTDISFVYAEGLAMNPETASRALKTARATMQEFLPKAAA